MLPTLLAQLNIHVPVTPLLLFSVGALVFASWLIFTIILRYHWKNYGMGGLELLSMNFLYIVGSLILAGLMFFSAFLYFTSTQ